MTCVVCLLQGKAWAKWAGFAIERAVLVSTKYWWSWPFTFIVNSPKCIRWRQYVGCFFLSWSILIDLNWGIFLSWFSSVKWISVFYLVLFLFIISIAVLVNRWSVRKWVTYLFDLEGRKFTWGLPHFVLKAFQNVMPVVTGLLPILIFVF